MAAAITDPDIRPCGGSTTSQTTVGRLDEAGKVFVAVSGEIMTITLIFDFFRTNPRPQVGSDLHFISSAPHLGHDRA
jgi:hypothetical protein